MARTNKIWIAKKKLQQAKQKKMIQWSTQDSQDISTKTIIKNPKWNDYSRFIRSGKYICDNTSVREDFDWYRLLRKPNWWEVEFKFLWENSWWYRKYIRKSKRLRFKI